MTLTPRELDVMVALAVTGGSYGDVADMLKIRPQTVKNHAYSARNKYGATSNTDLFIKAGWLLVPHPVPKGVRFQRPELPTRY